MFEFQKKPLSQVISELTSEKITGQPKEKGSSGAPKAGEKEILTTNVLDHFVEDSVDKAKAALAKSPSSRFVIAIGGLRGSGKSTAVERIKEMLPGLVETASMDSWFTPGGDKKKDGWDNPANSDLQDLKNVISQFKEGKQVQIRRGRVSDGSITTETSPQNARVLVVEGLFALDPQVVRNADFKAFMGITPALQQTRTTPRDISRAVAKTRSPDRNFGINFKVQPLAAKYVLPTIKNADLYYQQQWTRGDIEANAKNWSPSEIDKYCKDVGIDTSDEQKWKAIKGSVNDITHKGFKEFESKYSEDAGKLVLEHGTPAYRAIEMEGSRAVKAINEGGVVAANSLIERNETSLANAKALFEDLKTTTEPLEVIRKLNKIPPRTLQKAFGPASSNFIMFDLDGTLFDTDSAQRNGWIAAMNQLGLHTKQDDYLELANAVYENNKAIENLGGKHKNVRTIWNTRTFYGAISFLDSKSREKGSLDEAIREFNSALQSPVESANPQDHLPEETAQAESYRKKLDSFLGEVESEKNRAGSSRIKQVAQRITKAQQSFDSYCNHNVTPFEGVKESTQLLGKLGFKQVITTDGDKETQYHKVRDWLHLDGIFPQSHLICTKQSYPQEDMAYLRSTGSALQREKEHAAELWENTRAAQLEAAAIYKAKDKSLLDSSPMRVRHERALLAIDQRQKDNEFLRDGLSHLESKSRDDFYMNALQALSKSPENPAGWMLARTHGKGEAIKVASVGDSGGDVRIHRLNSEVIAVGVLTGKPKYRQEVSRVLKTPGIEKPERIKIADSFGEAVQFLANPKTWDKVNHIDPKPTDTVAPVEKPDALRALSIMAHSPDSVHRRIASEIAFGGGQYLTSAPFVDKQAVLEKFKTTRDPREQSAYARVLSTLASTSKERAMFADAVAERLPKLSIPGAKTALETLSEIGSPRHLEDVRKFRARTGLDTDARNSAKITESVLADRDKRTAAAQKRIARLSQKAAKTTNKEVAAYLTGQIRALGREHGLNVRPGRQQRKP